MRTGDPRSRAGAGREWKGRPVSDGRFTNDVARAFRRNAARYLWALRHRPLVYLEVGVHEGRSACWMLEHILLHPASRYIGIDGWGRSLAKQQAKARAQQNLQPYCRQVQLVEGHAQQVLAAGNWAPCSIDIAYLDADHRPAAVAENSRLLWRLVKVGGILIWDDLPWGAGEVTAGVRRFLTRVAGEYEVMFCNWQLGLRRTR